MSDARTKTPEPEQVKPDAVGKSKALVKSDEETVAEYVEKGRRRVAMNDQEVQVRILADMLRSESVEEMLSPRAVEPVKNVLGEPIEVTGFDLVESEHKSGLGFFAVISCTILDGERRTIVQCGAPEVVLKLMRFEDIDALPIQGKIVELNKPKDGRNAALGFVGLDVDDVALLEKHAAGPPVDDEGNPF